VLHAHICPWYARDSNLRESKSMTDDGSTRISKMSESTTRNCHLRRCRRKFHSHSRVYCKPTCRECTHCWWHTMPR
jgi:hypothetical protein